MRNKKYQTHSKGFTLIELLVVIAIIALLSSIALIALMSARSKSRDVKRASDMVQMNTALELYFSTFKGYPSATNGAPAPLVPTVATKLPNNPLPADGGCDSLGYTAPGVGNGDAYYYYPSGTAYAINGVTVYPDYAYYFCLGNTTGNLAPGIHLMTPRGLR